MIGIWISKLISHMILELFLILQLSINFEKSFLQLADSILGILKQVNFYMNFITFLEFIFLLIHLLNLLGFIENIISQFSNIYSHILKNMISLINLGVKIIEFFYFWICKPVYLIEFAYDYWWVLDKRVIVAILD